MYNTMYIVMYELEWAAVRIQGKVAACDCKP